MKGIAGFLLLTSLVSGCDTAGSPGESPQEQPLLAPPKQEPTGNAAPAALAGAAPSPATEVTAAATAKSDGPSAIKPDKSNPETSPALVQKLVSGATVSGEGFKVRIQTQSPQVVGKQGTLLVTLSADSPFKCNDKYPYKFKFEPIDGVSFPNETVRGMQVQKQSATMSVPFSPQHAGKQSVSGDLSFSVCTDDKCLVEKQRLTVSFDVVDPS